MMKQLRGITKLVIWPVALAFVGLMLFQWGMNIGRGRSGRPRSEDEIGRVYNLSLNREHLNDAYSRVLKRYREQTGSEVYDPRVAEELEDRAFDELITDVLVDHELDRRRIPVTDQEILTVMKAKPPSFIYEDSTFYTDGEFDIRKWLSLFNDPRAYPLLMEMERNYRQSRPFDKLQIEILSTVRLTNSEVQEAVEMNEEKVKVRYAFVNPLDFMTDTLQVTEADLIAYYEEHREEFERPEVANLRFVVVPKEPSQGDETEVRREIEEILLDLKAGADFDQLALDYSHDRESAAEGGDLGFFEFDEMDSTFSSVAFSLKPGELSEPVRTRYGWQIIKTVEKKGNKVRAKHILLTVYPSYETIVRLRTRVTELTADARERGLTEAAADFDLEVHETGPFPRISVAIPGIGQSERVKRFAFSSSVGSVSDPVTIRGAYCVAEVVERIPPTIPELDDIRPRVKGLVANAQRRELARREAEALLGEIKTGGSFVSAARHHHAEVETSKPFSRAEGLPNLTPFSAFHGAAFALSVGEKSGVVETTTGFYVIELLNRYPVPDEATEGEQLMELHQKLAWEKSRRVFEYYMEHLREQADIQDYRDLIL
jgi:peptidyl-prolyl cis-trans isomerase D